MKTLLAIAVAAVLASACGSSSDDGPSLLDDPTSSSLDTVSDQTPGQVPGQTPDEGSAPTPGSTDPAVTPGATGGDTPDASGNGTTGGGIDPGIGGDGGASAMPPAGSTDAPPAPRTPDEPSIYAPPLDEVANGLLVSLAGYGSEAGDARVRALADDVREGAIASRALPDGSFLTEDDVRSVTTPTTRTAYDCAQGGTMTTGETRVRILEPDFSRNVDVDEFTFEACRLDGERTLDGGLVATLAQESGNRYDTERRTREWSGFTLVDPAGAGLEIDGRTGFDRFNSNDTRNNRSVRLASYVETTRGAETLRMGDVSMDLSDGESGGGLFEDYALNVSGTIAADSTGGVPASVSTVAPLMRKRSRAEPGTFVGAEPFTGELELRAEDGRSVTLTARDAADEPLLVDASFTGADGTVRTAEAVPFAVLTPRADGDDAEPGS